MTDVFTWPVGRAAHEETGLPARHAPIFHVITYMTAATLGGAFTGYLIGQGGSLFRSVGDPIDYIVQVLAVGIALLATWLELRGRVTPLPQRRAQVRREWLSWRRRSLTAGAFGLMIGSGALTYLEHAVAYVLVAALLLSPSSLVALMIGASYGLTRGLTLLVTWLANSYLGRQIDWEWLIRAERLVGGTLAATSTVSLIGIAILSGSFGEAL